MGSTPWGGDEPLEISAEHLAEWRREGAAVAVLDVREPWEREICALDDALLMPMGQLQQGVGDLPADRPLVVICHTGVRSFHVTMWLRSQGFDQAWNLAGGIDAWAARIDPTMKRY